MLPPAPFRPNFFGDCSDEKFACVAEPGMTICRTTESGGSASARPAGGTRIDSHPDGARAASVIWAVILAIVATLVAGLYPAWSIGRVPPAVYLKSQ